MRDEEALQIGRKAVRDAQQRVGVDKNALEKEIEAVAETDQGVADALLQVGMTILRSQQETKH